ncbi:hypothetical protein PVL30_002631 [Lodderomyces elongisporus]|uniref:DUF2470 domain-containing protein n=1 Tax=Lodderomyces elongisporus (strain ATCC 11503 / CBS 2605 / JCM 1781 / NBRC 1676 / NRRL YB-4239) TaxID=379508 RepID=A5E0K2_LODEL|nr:uncharacterized protein PVL30_002631 [Lodderomyces elongisporus]EDK44960.1 conserved hypothetical protein [Lodderomyces elongisporus NRRL YB-4239]WLF78885.1 hypothetical protein PVL30_002631 [Lodderomyces elongisporus]
MSDPSARIISHMNRDHQLSLNDYVVVYGTVDSKYLVEDSVHITKVDLEQIVIEYDLINPSKTKTLALYWSDAEEYEKIEVKSWSDIKGKLIAMAKYCANKQGFEMHKLTKAEWPDLSLSGLFGWSMYPQWMVLILNSYNPEILRNLFANDALFNRLVKYLPSGAIRFYKYAGETHASKVLLTIVVLHLIEIFKETGPILKKNRAPGIVRAKWYFMNLIEGFPVLIRLKNLTK